MTVDVSATVRYVCLKARNVAQINATGTPVTLWNENVFLPASLSLWTIPDHPLYSGFYLTQEPVSSIAMDTTGLLWQWTI